MSARPDEPHATIFLERTFFADFVMTGVGFGSMTTCYFMCMATMFSVSRWTRSQVILAVYITTIFICGTLFFASDTVCGIKMFVDNREFPGGPSEYLLKNYNIAALIVANISYQTQSWLTDGLLLYRCLVIYGFNYWVLLFPGLIYLGSISMGTTLLVHEEHPSNSLWSKSSLNFAIPFFSLSISLNIVVTLLIASRLLLHRYRVRESLGNQHAKDYVSVTAMLVESAALNSFFSILYLIPYSRNLAVSNAFQGLAPEMQITATLLVAMRVAQGRGWTQHTADSLAGIATIEFASMPVAQRRGGGGSTSGGLTSDESFSHDDMGIPLEIGKVFASRKHPAKDDVVEMRENV